MFAHIFFNSKNIFENFNFKYIQIYTNNTQILILKIINYIVHLFNLAMYDCITLISHFNKNHEMRSMFAFRMNV